MNHRIGPLGLAITLLSIGIAIASGSAAAHSVAPAGKNLGVGIELGAPTNLNLKFMTSENTGVVLGIGGGIWYDASLSLHADYVLHPLVGSFDGGVFSAYVGIGAWTSLGVGGPNYRGPHYGYWSPYYDSPEYFALGVRVPLGLSMAFNAIPVELFIEAVPAIAVFPGIGGFGQGGFGGRFYF